MGATCATDCPPPSIGGASWGLPPPMATHPADALCHRCPRSPACCRNAYPGLRRTLRPPATLSRPAMIGVDGDGLAHTPRVTRAISSTPVSIHPRPLLHRDGWTSLDGEWAFAIDEPGEHREPGQVTFSSVIRVPFAPECAASVASCRLSASTGPSTPSCPSLFSKPTGPISTRRTRPSWPTSIRTTGPPSIAR